METVYKMKKCTERTTKLVLGIVKFHWF